MKGKYRKYLASHKLEAEAMEIEIAEKEKELNKEIDFDKYMDMFRHITTLQIRLDRANNYLKPNSKRKKELSTYTRIINRSTKRCC